MTNIQYPSASQTTGILRNPHTESRYSNVDTAGLTYSESAVSEASSFIADTQSQPSNSKFVDINAHQINFNQRDEIKIESKEHMWKPAPIMGRDFTQTQVNEPNVVRPQANQITAQLRDPMQNNFVLPSHF